MNPLIHELRVGRISKNITISENMSMCSSVDCTNAAYEVQRSRRAYSSQEATERQMENL